MKSWYDEINLYDYNHPGFSNKRGHFTGLLWRDTLELGIAEATNNRTAKTFIVANYNSPAHWQEKLAEMTSGSNPVIAPEFHPVNVPILPPNKAPDLSALNNPVLTAVNSPILSAIKAPVLPALDVPTLPPVNAAISDVLFFDVANLYLIWIAVLVYLL